MRFLGVTETCDLAALYIRLAEEGHMVRVAVTDPAARGTAAGLIAQIVDWRSELDWIADAGAEGIIIFESVSEGFGAIQDQLRAQGFNVIGGGAFGDRLENDRAFAQALLGDLGFPTGHVWEFSNWRAADRFIAERPGRYVLKFSGADHVSQDNYLGQTPNGRDVRAVLSAHAETGESGASFILMEFIEGIEIGVGAYFDGERFLLPACLDWEHKRFFAGDMGELTGEMGTVATFDRSRHLFDQTLAKVEPLLRGRGHVGYINLNTIVNDQGIWPLEFTCRFGYPGFAVLDPLQRTGWGELFRGMTSRSTAKAFAIDPGFSLGVVLTTPPFPYTRKQIIGAPIGLPVLLSDALDAEDRRHLHYGEVGLQSGQLVTSGLYGWTMVVTGTGATIATAKQAAYARIDRIIIPNMRYRLDIGDRLIGGDYARIEAMGLLDRLHEFEVRTDGRSI